MRTLYIVSWADCGDHRANCCSGETGLLFPMVWLLLGPEQGEELLIEDWKLPVSYPDGVVFIRNAPQ